ELEAAQILVRDVDDASPADMGGDLLENLAAIGEHAKAAASASDDLVWHAAEWLPIVGDNLRAVRLASESLDAVANDVGIPALAAVGQPGSAPP
ncbi:hypothetical protein, partial [Streptomyces turgidiscabies]|uniref:hypothetical protein n=1 Tax=Streptomyces turgidiscabies TaxID=85558 RepID=UPI0038F6FE68